MSTIEAQRRASKAYRGRIARYSITLSKNTAKILEQKATEHGLPVATYVRKLIEADLYNSDNFKE